MGGMWDSVSFPTCSWSRGSKLWLVDDPVYFLVHRMIGCVGCFRADMVTTDLLVRAQMFEIEWFECLNWSYQLEFTDLKDFNNEAFRLNLRLPSKDSWVEYFLTKTPLRVHPDTSSSTNPMTCVHTCTGVYLLAETAPLGKALMCSKKWIHYRPGVDPHICSASIMYLPGARRISSVELCNAPQFDECCIGPQFSARDLARCNQQFRTLFKHGCSTCLYRDLWIRFPGDYDWMGKELKAWLRFAGVFRLYFICTEGVVSWLRMLPMHQSNVVFSCFLFDSQNVPSIILSFGIVPHGCVPMISRSLLLDYNCSNHKVMTEKYWPFWGQEHRPALWRSYSTTGYYQSDSTPERSYHFRNCEMRRKTGEEAIVKVTSDLSALWLGKLKCWCYQMAEGSADIYTASGWLYVRRRWMQSLIDLTPRLPRLM